ncbi:MAG: hypothetical protein F4X36_00140 [Gammaproteobacteria bacterium]|nr:hypothetical protein [Gammaproteobacteria bacterium]
MTDALLSARFAPILDEVEKRACVADAFVDKEVYRILLATVWANVVMNPDEAGIDIADLERLHDVINARARDVLGSEDAIKDCFRFVTSRAGEAAMDQARLNKTHRELLLYFSSMILDPDGHRRWMAEVERRAGDS